MPRGRDRIDPWRDAARGCRPPSSTTQHADRQLGYNVLVSPPAKHCLVQTFLYQVSPLLLSNGKSREIANSFHTSLFCTWICAVIFTLLSFISQFNSAGSFCASPSSVLPSQNRLFLSILLRCRRLLLRRRRRRDYAVARFRKKMNYLFVRPPPKRRGEVNAIELALPPRNLRRVTHLYTQVRQDRSLALIADCGREREGGRRGGPKQSFIFRPRLL